MKADTFPPAVTVGQTWQRAGSMRTQTVLALLPGYVRLSVPGEIHRGAFIDIPRDRFGGDGPYAYELVRATPIHTAPEKS